MMSYDVRVSSKQYTQCTGTDRNAGHLLPVFDLHKSGPVHKSVTGGMVFSLGNALNRNNLQVQLN